MTRVAIGFRVKSGHVIAVVLSGTAATPSLVLRTDVALSDPKVRETRQPYHHGFFRCEEDARVIAGRVRIVERCAKQSVASLLRSVDAGSVRAALVVGSVVDPDTIGNPHIRAHAFEGQLFRRVLADALDAHGIACDVIVEKELAARSRSVTGCSAARIAQTVAAFADGLDGPWRADEKAAATAGWMMLCRRGQRSGSATTRP